MARHPQKLTPMSVGLSILLTGPAFAAQDQDGCDVGGGANDMQRQTASLNTTTGSLKTIDISAAEGTATKALVYHDQHAPETEGGVGRRTGSINISQILGKAAWAQEPKVVFVTSKTYTGALGGLTGADQICKGHAERAGLSGTFKAWLSTLGGISPNNRFTRSPGRYILTNGTPIANNYTDLITCGPSCIAAPINFNEYGNQLPGDPNSNIVWTGTRANGDSATSANLNSNCKDWTAKEACPPGGGNCAHVFGMAGASNRTDRNWTEDFQAGTCFVARRLYCFAQ
jgi:Collagenase NC10 and Endostatin.